MAPYPLTNFEIQKYYWMEHRFNGVFSRNNLHEKIKDGAYVINLDEYADVSTHWTALFCDKSEIVYFDSFSVEHVRKEIKEFIGNKNIITNIFWVQANNFVLCSSSWLWEKRSNNVALFQRWIKSTEQTWLIGQNSD